MAIAISLSAASAAYCLSLRLDVETGNVIELRISDRVGAAGLRLDLCECVAVVASQRWRRATGDQFADATALSKSIVW